MTTRRLVAALALATVALAAPPAVAAADSRYDGGCTYQVEADPTRREGWRAAVWSATVVYSEATPTDNPVSATVTCTVTVNGGAVAATTFSGTGVVAGVERVAFTAGETDVVELCETVDYTSNDTPTTTHCHTPSGPPVVPQPVRDFFWALVDLLVQCCFPDDAPLCPILAALAPGVPGVVDVDWEGDVTVAGDRYWDCPPYGV